MAVDSHTVELTAGPVSYVDTGGTGPVVVFAHGLPMTHTQWRKVVPLLDGCRCVLPTLPMGGHRHPMHPSADLTHEGVARLLGEFLRRLDLRDATLVLNDWGGGQLALIGDASERITRAVLVACEAFDNYPPAPARPLAVLARVPGGMWLVGQALRVRAIRRSRRCYGAMSLRGIPDDVLLDWLAPARTNRHVRRDLAKFARSAPARRVQLGWSESLRSYPGEVLVVWADRDPLMPAEHGPRLADLYRRSRYVRIENSSTLIPEDQPEQLARLIDEFVSSPQS